MIETPLLPAVFSLLTVARTGSVGAAARHHHLTSSAISQQMRRLEAHVGVKLLERAGRGVRLTAAGEAVLPALGRLWAETDTCFGEFAALSKQPVTTVRVAASDYLGKSLLVPVLRALVDEGVPVRFEIVTTHSRDAIGRVTRGEIEFGVVSADVVPAGLDARRLFDQTFAWVGTRRRTRSASLVERLASEPLLRLGAESHGRRLLDDFLARARIRPVSTIDVTSVSLLLAYVSGGLGVGLAPTLALGDVDARRVIVERAEVPPLPVQLVSRPVRVRSPAAERFADALVREGRGRGRAVPDPSGGAASAPPRAEERTPLIIDRDRGPRYSRRGANLYPRA
jgi:DNA-binding transcriptional LysR family regulator